MTGAILVRAETSRKYLAGVVEIKKRRVFTAMNTTRSKPRKHEEYKQAKMSSAMSFAVIDMKGECSKRADDLDGSAMARMFFTMRYECVAVYSPMLTALAHVLEPVE